MYRDWCSRNDGTRPHEAQLPPAGNWHSTCPEANAVAPYSPGLQEVVAISKGLSRGGPNCVPSADPRRTAKNKNKKAQKRMLAYYWKPLLLEAVEAQLRERLQIRPGSCKTARSDIAPERCIDAIYTRRNGIGVWYITETSPS